MIEREIFERREIHFDELEKFGFIRSEEGFALERKIYGGMLARVTITPSGEVKGKVVDEELGEEYVNHRLEDASGAFVVGVRNAYIALLTEIADAVTTEKRYIGDQTNRIDAFLTEKYGASPEFLWEKFPHFGVYRNRASGKWIAIIMNIAKAKVVVGAEGKAEVMNLKLGDRAPDFLGESVYPSYHMNHKSWVSVLLDGSLSDALIEEMIAISYQNSFNSKKK